LSPRSGGGFRHITRAAPLVISAALAVLIASAASALQTAPAPATAAPAATAGNAPAGKLVYEQRCVECHGATGKGDGPASDLLTPRPRDFTLGRYKIRSTETGSIPTDADLLRSVGKGLYGSAMPGWETIISDKDIHDVVAYLKTLSPRFAAETPRAIVNGPQVVTSPESVRRGYDVYATLQCGKCHGSDGRGSGATATTFADDWQQPLRAADLTEPWTFHGGPGSQDIYMRFSAGMSGTPMPSFKDTASDTALWDLANYVVSLARKPLWSMNAEEVAAFYAREDADARANPVKRGQYLVDTIGCALCHSPVDQQKRMIPGLKMAGGFLIHVEPFGDYPAGNLTSDKETGLGNWTDDDITRVLTRGILKDGTRLLPYPMDWPSYSTIKPEDLHAIVAYLRTLPPVSNKIPPPRRTWLPAFLWGKFKFLILGVDPPMIFYPGNVGSASGGRP
jgi:cytochrome c oxidase cbb3-type subunit 2